jgi:hypothetical protein
LQARASTFTYAATPSYPVYQPYVYPAYDPFYDPFYSPWYPFGGVVFDIGFGHGGGYGHGGFGRGGFGGHFGGRR